MKIGWKEVYMTTSEYKAQMAKDILHNDGVKAVIMNQHDSAHKSFGEYYIYVRSTEVTEAVEILRELKRG